ncbi:HNH endonuclease signature motif containing protein [Pseudomonas hefeiensis]
MKVGIGWGLSQSFNERNLKHMLNGSAAYPSQLDQVGGRKKFELHHKVEVAKGGGVYDMENLVVMTPKRHIHIHKGNGQ